MLHPTLMRSVAPTKIGDSFKTVVARLLALGAVPAEVPFADRGAVVGLSQGIGFYWTITPAEVVQFTHHNPT